MATEDATVPQLIQIRQSNAGKGGEEVSLHCADLWADTSGPVPKTRRVVAVVIVPAPASGSWAALS
ncbi:hypothetical protein ABT382_15975 [Streptomyces pharetrae]|uniref:hypothetical protein n=1 Tax=Streptomyces pharetrae TaxID=291370 RepID=UPI0033528EE5